MAAAAAASRAFAAAASASASRAAAIAAIAALPLFPSSPPPPPPDCLPIVYPVLPPPLTDGPHAERPTPAPAPDPPPAVAAPTSHFARQSSLYMLRHEGSTVPPGVVIVVVAVAVSSDRGSIRPPYPSYPPPGVEPSGLTAGLLAPVPSFRPPEGGVTGPPLRCCCFRSIVTRGAPPPYIPVAVSVTPPPPPPPPPPPAAAAAAGNTELAFFSTASDAEVDSFSHSSGVSLIRSVGPGGLANPYPVHRLVVYITLCSSSSSLFIVSPLRWRDFDD